MLLMLKSSPIFKILLGFISCLFLLPGQAEEYYICGNGNDSNDGLSHETAWKTYKKAYSLSRAYQGGDKILFCKGGYFTMPESSRWENFNTKKDNRITFSSYSPNGQSNLDNPTIFFPNGDDGFQIMNGGAPVHMEGFIISDLILKGNKEGGGGIVIYNDTDFVDIIDVEIYDFKIGIHLGGANPAKPGVDRMNSDVTIKRAYIHDNKGQGFLGGGDNLVIEDSLFVNNGFEKRIFNHNIYISGGVSGARDIVVRNNKLYQSAIFEGACSGASLVVHGNHTNLLIENNVIWEDANATTPYCWGIAVDNGYGGGELEKFSELVIRNNTVANTGGVGIGCAVCQDVVIENNTILHQTSFGGTIIKVPDRNENQYPMLPNTNNVIVRNNTILYDTPSEGVGVSLGDGDGSSYKSVGNKVYYGPESGMIEGCEIYNDKDNVIDSQNTCIKGIPKKLLDAVLDKTVIQVN